MLMLKVTLGHFQPTPPLPQGGPPCIFREYSKHVSENGEILDFIDFKLVF